MVVMSSFSMSVSMPQLFRGGIPYRDNFDFKGERHACQGMVAVDHYGIAVKLCNVYVEGVSVLILGLQSHADFQIVNSCKLFPRQRLHHLIVVVAIGIRGGYLNDFGGADVQAGQRLF